MNAALPLESRPRSRRLFFLEHRHFWRGSTGHLVARTSSCSIVISGEAGHVLATVDHRHL